MLSRGDYHEILRLGSVNWHEVRLVQPFAAQRLVGGSGNTILQGFYFG